MKLLLALVLGVALLAPIRANADKVYDLYWVTYNPPNSTMTLVDPKKHYQTFDDCQAAQIHYGTDGPRWWSNTGYYLCL